MPTELFVVLTADCETAHCDLDPPALAMSGSGPADYAESERSIRGYAAVANGYGFPLTLFIHPEVAAAHPDLFLELERGGACLGLHVHPYKLLGERYSQDLGAYSAPAQSEMLSRCQERWATALGTKPLYFRAGYFSANDHTFRVLAELGFRGGGVSIPGRILPTHQSIWAGADPYPHRAHLDFRHLRGDSDFIEVPVAVDFGQPLERGAAGERGYAWPYVPAGYRHRETIQGILERIRADEPPVAAIVLDTHNDQEYSDPTHPSRRNLELILETTIAHARILGLHPRGATIQTVCDVVRDANA